MRQLALLPILALALSGCALFQKEASTGGPASITGPSEAQPATEIAESGATAALGANAVRAAVLDTTSSAEKAAALAAPAQAGERELGRVVVALGSPADKGLWLSSVLVKEVAQGRIVTAEGQSLTLELRPGTGAALLSLAAFQALGLSLTGLPEVTVYGP
ncbi:MAG: D-galactarate dehydratase [Tabrizicola sp.]|nr:D-galactarate dehydratase [Tabrizicola sp.]